MRRTLKSCRFLTTHGKEASLPTATVTFGSGSGISGFSATDVAPSLMLAAGRNSAAYIPVMKKIPVMCNRALASPEDSRQ